MAVALGGPPPAGADIASLEAVRLPPLREDLRLLPGAPTAEGSPTWTLHDPARHRFMRIGWLEFEILARWSLGRVDEVAKSIAAETTIRATPEQVLEVLHFAHRAGLILPQGEGGTKRLVAETDAQRLSMQKWLLKNYLFLKLRLVNPDRALDAAMPYVGWMLTKGFLLALGLLAALGFYLISRQWEAYVHSFLHLFSLQGAAMVGLALAASKVIHECGHALVTKRFGCRVPAMGVALLVLWPVLWTDTTDAWRLTDRRQRLAIDAAGMLAEITLAVVASLLWSVLPDGALRTGCFLLSSSTWLLTVMVNINPLMRFDGYFILSDWLDVPNLQERGFAMGRWWLREQLFGLGEQPPEQFPADRKRIVIAYALATLVYRFFLFTGIALIVYHMAFKALGIFLMAVEIWWFILRPIINELKVWRQRLGSRRLTRRALGSLGVGGLVILLLALPWHGSVIAPALLRDSHQTILYTAEPGQMAVLARNGQHVKTDDTVFRLVSPEIAFHKASAQAELAGIDARMKGQSFDPEQASAVEVGWEELQGASASLRQVLTQEADLTIRAPFDGVIVDVPPSLRVGEWLPRREALGMLIDPGSQTVEAYIDEADLARLHQGAKARFVPENGEAPVPLTLVSLGTAPVSELDSLDLASTNGGGIAVRKDAQNRLVPEAAIYRAILKPDEAVRLPIRLRGNVVVEADRASMLVTLYRRAAAIVIREMGF
ncbi:MAG TPA: HlyD family efflux transporter periplasmic adaptor subunit [Stellaceae bacterium]|nr:HlyD family efflux transporter periplasmic adaptor subunit [Stellaceae bacterium]